MVQTNLSSARRKNDLFAQVTSSETIVQGSLPAWSLKTSCLLEHVVIRAGWTWHLPEQQMYTLVHISITNDHRSLLNVSMSGHLSSEVSYERWLALQQPKSSSAVAICFYSRCIANIYYSSVSFRLAHVCVWITQNCLQTCFSWLNRLVPGEYDAE